jgi:hypothetical protein
MDMSTIRAKQLLLAALLAGAGWSCDDAEADRGRSATAACVPSCLRRAMESCQPQGSCVGEASPDSSATSGQVWLCFANGVRLHMIRSSVESTTQVVEENGKLCRTIESTEGAEGGRFIIKNAEGEQVAALWYSSFPDLTISCEGAEHKLDRTSDCGRAALLLLGPDQSKIRSCIPGSCQGP